MPDYNTLLREIKEPTFQRIRQLANQQLSHLSRSQRDVLWEGLKRGTALLDSHEHLCQYLHSFGNMHQAKLLDAFKRLPLELFTNDFEVVDWGCGQAMGVINLYDYLNSLGRSDNIKKVTLIEPAKTALERGRQHVSAYMSDTSSIETIGDFFENIKSETLTSESGLPVLHIFSNILDVAQIDLKLLASLIDKSSLSKSYLLSVGPLNPNNHRMDAFFRYFKEEALDQIYSFDDSNFCGKNWTYKARVFQLNSINESVLIPIDFYPHVQFTASYELDHLRHARKIKKINFPRNLSHFEVAAPFDLGANVYEDVHPILAVLNNIINRGLPTKSSIFIEEKMQKAFEHTSRVVKYGEINYINKDPLDYEKLINQFSKHSNKNISLPADDKVDLQKLLTPVAIARFHKVLIEAIITNHLSLDKKRWLIMVEEKDVPFGAIAIEDFRQLFNNLTKLSDEYENLKLPEIELHILSNKDFYDSPLHGDYSKTYLDVPDSLFSKRFDLVIQQSILETEDYLKDNFSKYKCNNNCYFNLTSASTIRLDRFIYTAKLIKYKSLVSKDEQGNYIELSETSSHLTYFLQLFFRKEAFRPGQLPILDRALKNLPVIGLLPTGGGKSLTYQISALLQPGVTMIIDPLKSLMKDQYDGLVNNGIDSAAFINSSLSFKKRKSNEIRLKSSQLLFIFLSPERLSIASFRDELEHMHDYNVYFSYGVIDEVHCVSEWGHDFRFSYLHLGRNLYNYVKAKDGNISLLGLTATASFDVLADVERELSGNGAFQLDTETIVRYENTNRLELQYKIEKVPITFEVDQFYDSNNAMPAHLPKALNIRNQWPQFESKGAYIQQYIESIPQFVNELQQADNLKIIRQRYIDRQNNEIGADIDIAQVMDSIPLEAKDSYNEAGIVFCPHVNGTGVSVNSNTQRLRENLFPNVNSFSGRDNDNDAINSLEGFRENKSPLMIATKAFGMGIDKPNVRYTINLNYSSSLESFVQEAGRAGRDRKLALATIFVSDYDLVSIKRTTTVQKYPIGIIRNKWFHKNDLKEILDEFNLEIPDEDLIYGNPQEDIVKLHCSKDNIMFAYQRCNDECSAYNSCSLKYANNQSRGWMSEKSLIKELQAQGISVSKKNFQYLNPDYKTVMYFFNENFKGDNIEKKFMVGLLDRDNLTTTGIDEASEVRPVVGFLESILNLNEGDKIVINVPYNSTNYPDVAKAIYRMCCIQLIDDFTQNYRTHTFRIVTVRRSVGGYYEGLKSFLLRYFTNDRAELEIAKAKNISLNANEVGELRAEIYRCLSYLTEFVYDKISEKRKRAIDDMRSFCMDGLNPDVTWIESNEILKDFIFYYFNSKYAKTQYVLESGEPFSLVDDTEGGKISNVEILFKYLRVIEDDVVGVGTPLDNAKHLYGAVRLITKSLTDSNPVLALLEAFCLVYLGTRGNKNLENQLETKYNNGMLELFHRHDNNTGFWMVFEKYNRVVNQYAEFKILNEYQETVKLLIHSELLNNITSQYLETNE